MFSTEAGMLRIEQIC